MQINQHNSQTPKTVMNHHLFRLCIYCQAVYLLRNAALLDINMGLLRNEVLLSHMSLFWLLLDSCGFLGNLLHFLEVLFTHVIHIAGCLTHLDLWCLQVWPANQLRQYFHCIFQLPLCEYQIKRREKDTNSSTDPVRYQDKRMLHILRTTMLICLHILSSQYYCMTQYVRSLLHSVSWRQGH